MTWFAVEIGLVGGDEIDHGGEFRFAAAARDVLAIFAERLHVEGVEAFAQAEFDHGPFGRHEVDAAGNINQVAELLKIQVVELCFRESFGHMD